MSESDLLATILAEPDNEQPRLVFADWLEEHDQAERAEFIRVQCEVARLTPGDPRWAELEARQWPLLDPVRRGPPAHPSAYYFSGGRQFALEERYRPEWAEPIPQLLSDSLERLRAPGRSLLRERFGAGVYFESGENG